MEFEWDINKEKLNLRKHGIPFPFATRFFLGANRMERLNNRDNCKETRWLTIGLVDAIEIVVCYTIRGEKIRIISARKAEHHERKKYWAR